MSRRSRKTDGRPPAPAAAPRRPPAPRRAGTPTLRAALALIVLAGLLIRVAYFAELRRQPDYDAPLADARYNDYWARAIATGDWKVPAESADPRIPTTPFFRPPGYAYALAAIYLVAGGGYAGPRIVQIGFGLANIVLAFGLGRALFGRRAGLFGAALVASFWTLVYFEGELHPVTFFTTLGLVLLLLAHRWAAGPGPGRAAVAGLMLGLMALLRSEVLLFGAVFLAWQVWVLRTRGTGRRRTLAWLAATAGTAALVIAPATLRNALAAGEFVPISTNAGLNLYIGNNPSASPVTPRVPGLEAWTGHRGWDLFQYAAIVDGLAAEEGLALSHSDASRIFARRALAFMAAEPGRTLALAARRLALMWGPFEVSNNKVDQLEREHSRVLRHLPGFPAALAGFLVGLVLWRRERPQGPDGRAARQTAVLAILFVAAQSAAFIPFLAAGRYRVPYTPVMLLFAGHAAAWIVDRLAAGARGQAAGAAAGLVAVFGLAHLNPADYQPDRSSWHLDRASAQRQKGELEAALAEYRAAVAADPGSPDAHAALAAALLAANDAQAAVAAFGRALEIVPSSAEIRRSLALALTRLDRHREAAAELRQVLEQTPAVAETWYLLGRAEAADGRTEPALEAYGRALELEPDLVEPRVNRAILLYRKGSYEEAIAEHRRALERDPNRFEAHYNLAGALWATGRLDEAYEEMSAALTIAPGHSLAVSALHALQAARQAARTGPAGGEPAGAAAASPESSR